MRNGTVTGPLVRSDLLGPKFPVLLVNVSHYTETGHVKPHLKETPIDAVAAFPTRAEALRAALAREPLSVHAATRYVIVSPHPEGGISYLDTLGEVVTLERVVNATKKHAQPAGSFTSDEVANVFPMVELAFGPNRDVFAIGGIDRENLRRLQPDDPQVTGYRAPD